MAKPPKNLHIDSTFQDLYESACDNETIDLSEEIIQENCGERYSEWELIGQGGLKKVYRVYDHKTSRHVAMAMLNDPKDSAKKQLFIRESRLTALLDHPGIITLHDLGIDEEGTPFFTMELREHNSLDRLIQNYADIPLAKRLEKFSRICKTMAYAHSRNIIHLDLKPENIQIGTFGEIQICDWGLGKIIGECEQLHSSDKELLQDILGDNTLHGKIKGTPGYMAPEQITSSLKDQRTDIYSLGCILYTLICGHAPHSGKQLEVFEQTLKGDIVPLKQLDPSISLSISSVCTKALQLKPEDRYQTCQDLLKDVDNYLTGFATSAEQAGAAKQALLFYQRNKAVCTSILAATGILFAGTAFFIHQLKLSKKLAQDNEQKTLLANEALSETLVNYKSECYWTQTILSRQPDVGILVSYLFTDTKVYVEPMDAINKAYNILNRLIEENPHYNKSYVQRGIVKILGQDFNGALEDFKKSHKEVDDILTYLKANAPYKSTNPHLALNDMRAFIQHFGSSSRDYRRRLVLKMLMVDRHLRPNIQDHLKLVMLNLKNWNPQWDNTQYSYEPDHGGRLKIFGKELKQINIFLSPERSPLHDIGQSISLLSSFEFGELDISESGINDYRELRNLRFKTLVISEGQIQAGELDKLEEEFTIKKASE